MTLEWWFAYLLTSIILSLSPGSGAINTMTTSLNHGYRGAVASIAGLQTGLAIHIVLVGVGLGTLFSRSVNKEDRIIRMTGYSDYILIRSSWYIGYWARHLWCVVIPVDC